MRAEDILRKRKDRAIAIILSFKEREIDALLPQSASGRQASTALRKCILDQINGFYEIALDIVSSGDAEGFEFNPEVWVPRIEGRLDALRREVAALGDGARHAS